MNVLHLYSGNLYGGIERVLGVLARCRHLAPEMAPEFGLCFRGRLWDELEAAGATVHDLGPVRVSRPWTVVRARRRAAALLGRFDAAVCHANWPHAVFAPVVRRAGRPVVTSIHDTMAAGGWLNRWAARTPPDLAVANSAFTAGTVAAVFPAARVEVIHYPVDAAPVADPAAARRDVRAELGTPPDATVIFQASRLERWKGAAVLVEAFGRLADVPGWVGWVAGGPQKDDEAAYLAELKGRAAALGVADRVRFLGQRADVPRLMAAADVFCQPNTGPEPFGVVFVEALAAGLPAVSAALGGAAEVITPACGRLVPPGDPGAVAAAVRDLIADPARRRALGAAGPARAAELCDPGRQLGRLAAALAAARSRR